MALDPLLVLYRDSVPIINTLARQYQTVALSPRGQQVQYRKVEDAVQSIGHSLVSMGAPDKVKMS